MFNVAECNSVPLGRFTKATDYLYSGITYISIDITEICKFISQSN